MDNGKEPDELEEELAQEMYGGQFVHDIFVGKAFFGKKALQMYRDLETELKKAWAKHPPDE